MEHFFRGTEFNNIPNIPTVLTSPVTGGVTYIEIDFTDRVDLCCCGWDDGESSLFFEREEGSDMLEVVFDGDYQIFGSISKKTYRGTAYEPNVLEERIIEGLKNYP